MVVTNDSISGHQSKTNTGYGYIYYEEQVCYTDGDKYGLVGMRYPWQMDLVKLPTDPNEGLFTIKEKFGGKTNSSIIYERGEVLTPLRTVQGKPLSGAQLLSQIELCHRKLSEEILNISTTETAHYSKFTDFVTDFEAIKQISHTLSEAQALADKYIELQKAVRETQNKGLEYGPR